MRDEFIRRLSPAEFAAWQTLSKLDDMTLATILALQFEERWKNINFVVQFRDVQSYEASTALQEAIEGSGKYTG